MTPESMKGVTQNIVSLGLDDDDIDALPSAKGVKVELLSYQGFQNKPSLSLEVGEHTDDEYISMPRRDIWIGGSSDSLDITKEVEKGKRIFEIKNPYSVMGIAVKKGMDHLGFCSTELNGIDGIRTLPVIKRSKGNFLDANEPEKFDEYAAGTGSITLQLTFGKSINKGSAPPQLPKTTPAAAPNTSAAPSAKTASAPAAKVSSAPAAAPPKEPRKVVVDLLSYQGFAGEPRIWMNHGCFTPKYENNGSRGGGVFELDEPGANSLKFKEGELRFEVAKTDWDESPFFGFLVKNCYRYVIGYAYSAIDGKDGVRTLPLQLRKKENWADQEGTNFATHNGKGASITVKVTHSF
jgi:hypothetical protein